MAIEYNNPVLQTILSRRSVRKYRPEQLEESLLQAILQAGRYAPSGGNSQTTHFLVLQNPQVLTELKKLVVEEFAKMEITDSTYNSIVKSIRASQAGYYDFMFGAPTLVVTANRTGYGNAMADCAAALENMMLAASSLGVGSCWVNQLRWLDGNGVIRAFLEQLGLDRGETVCGAVALGMPDQPKQPPLERKGNPVTYVR